MSRYYVATSWHNSGHSPTQQQISQAMQSFQHFPSTHAYNIANWQPHLENEHMVPRIWQWIEHYAQCTLDYKSMPLADKQVWWLVVPENLSTEQNETLLMTGEEILTRQHLAQKASDAEYYFDVKGNEILNQALVREILPRTYMQLHAMIDHMHTAHQYYPLMLNKPSIFAKEFNAEFGKFFGHSPVLPLVMATFYSTPKTVKHHDNKRKLNVSANGALTASAPYEVDYADGSVDTTPHYWWVEGKMGAKLSVVEKRQLFVLQKYKDFNPDVSVDFDLNKDLF